MTFRSQCIVSEIFTACVSATASVAGRSLKFFLVVTATRVIDRMTGRARQGARDRREEHDVHVIHCSPTPRRISVRNTAAASESLRWEFTKPSAR